MGPDPGTRGTGWLPSFSAGIPFHSAPGQLRTGYPGGAARPHGQPPEPFISHHQAEKYGQHHATA
jgi:hypothetical protein